MCETIHVERCAAREGYTALFNAYSTTGSIELQRFGVSAQTTARDVTDDTIHSLGLKIGLRMICCGHIKSCAKHLEDGLQELPSEARIAIRDNCQRQTVLSKYSIDEKRSCT